MDPTPDNPDPLQGHTREWPSTPYSDEAREAEPSWTHAISVALIGDCTVSCTCLPPAMRPENQLLVRLRRRIPDRRFLVWNLSEDGDTAAGFLRRFESALTDLPRVDAAFLRYGVNDRKKHGVSECIYYLEEICRRLGDRYPGTVPVIETGIWVDYPAHYLWDRNSRLAPLYEEMRRFARERAFPIIDIFRNMEIETRRGNWDLRVRGLPDHEHVILDNSFDRFYGDDPAFFTNIHPNVRCLGLIAGWQAELLSELLGRSDRTAQQC